MSISACKHYLQIFGKIDVFTNGHIILEVPDDSNIFFITLPTNFKKVLGLERVEFFPYSKGSSRVLRITNHGSTLVHLYTSPGVPVRIMRDNHYELVLAQYNQFIIDLRGRNELLNLADLAKKHKS